MLTGSRSRTWRAATGALLVLAAFTAGAGAALASYRTVSAADALAVATAISVRQADLPADKQEPNPVNATERRQNAQLIACVGGVPESEALADTQSPSFIAPTSGSATVSSGTEILPSSALVAKDLAAITGSRGLPCLLKLLRSELVGKPTKGETVTANASRRSPVVSGTDGAFAFGFSIVIGEKRGTTTLTLPLYVDLIGFTLGQAEVSLTVMTVGAAPPASLEHRLALLLLIRARSALG